jgi:hypothetical protein
MKTQLGLDLFDTGGNLPWGQQVSMQDVDRIPQVLDTPEVALWTDQGVNLVTFLYQQSGKRGANKP